VKQKNKTVIFLYYVQNIKYQGVVTCGNKM